MRLYAMLSAALALFGAANASAATFVFDTDPFAGTDALSTPGRQIIGNESFITFDPATDQFVLEGSVFKLGSLSFANDFVANLPISGLNVAVLQTLDDDGDPLTPFGAGSAATLLANQITSDGAGMFIYFNSGLATPRLVFSTNLSDPAADLKIIARMTNLAGNPGSLAGFGEGNFAVQNPVPEPATWMMLLLGFGAVGYLVRSSRRREKLSPSYA